MANLHILYGLPGAGKSSYVARRWAGQPVQIVCGDHVRLALGHEYYRPAEALVRGIVQAMVLASCQTGRDVVLDDVNLMPEDVAPAVEAARCYGYNVVLHVVATPVEICRRRRVDRGFPPEDFARHVAARTAHEDVIRGMADAIITNG